MTASVRLVAAVEHARAEPVQVRRALRLLQIVDEVLDDPKYRNLRIEAMTALGGALGLVCTGHDEGEGCFDHSGGTCPVHEWLDPIDGHILTGEPHPEMTLAEAQAAVARTVVAATPHPAMRRFGIEEPR